jgi:hypothetical protein
MFRRRPYFWLCLGATALFLCYLWLESGGQPPDLRAVTQEPACIACQQGARAEYFATKAVNLVFGLIIYLAAIVLIWSHAFLWSREKSK